MDLGVRGWLCLGVPPTLVSPLPCRLPAVLHAFPAVAITNHHGMGDNTGFWRSEVPNQFCWAGIKELAGPCSLLKASGWDPSSPLPAPGGSDDLGWWLGFSHLCLCVHTSLQCVCYKDTCNWMEGPPGYPG